MKRLLTAALVCLAIAGTARAQFKPTDATKYPNLFQPVLLAVPPDLPDVPECRGILSQFIIDLVNNSDDDPGDKFEKNRREHPHMIMMPPPLECASKLFKALRRGPKLTSNSATEPEGTDVISLRQYPIDSVFDPHPLAASVGANIDPTNGVEGYQGENNISINPNNPQQIIAHSNTFYKDPNANCQSPTGGSANTYGTMSLFGTTNGGSSWTYNCAPWPATVTGGVAGADAWFGSDPALAWDNSGRAYACYMLISLNSSTNASGASIVVARSTDSGVSWSSLGTVTTGITSTTQGNDKQMMAIDNTSGQPFSHPGRIYVIWDAANAEKIAYSDNGTAWTTVNFASNTGAIGGNVVVGADGTVYVIWNRYNVETIVFSKSTDGGATWTAPAVIATTALQSFGSNNLPPAQDQRGINAFGAIDIDRNPASPFFGTLYVSFPDFPAGVASGTDINTYVIRSTNGGASWSSRVKVNDDGFSATQFFPWLAVDQSDGTVNVSWYDTRLDPLNRKTQMVYARSSNGGVSFEPNILISDNGANFRNAVNYADESSSDNTSYNGNQYGDYSGIAALNRQVHPLWTDSRMFFPLADTQSPTRREDNGTSTIINCSAPTAVAAPSVNSTTTPSVVVSWVAPAGWGTNATNGTYSVYRSTTAVFPGGSPLASGLTSTSYVDTTGTPGTTYFYFVRATNNCPGTTLTPMSTDSAASTGVLFGSAGSAVGTLQGTVTSAGNPVSGANVTAGALSATTNASGFYQFAAIGVGTYTVAASATGYTSASAPGVAVTSGATTVRNFSLTPTTSSACLTDTTYNDFNLGSGTSVDIGTSPGNVRLALTGSEALDQNSAPGGTLSATNNITSTQWIGQTFRAGASGNLTKITIALGLASGGTSGTITLEVRNVSGTNPGTTVLASATVGPITNVLSAVIYQATFATPAAVVSGTSYSIVLKANTGSTAFAVRGANSSLANGQWFVTTNSGGAWTSQNQDLYFATYVTPTTLQSAGNFVSSTKDSGAVIGSSATWTTLSWTAATPANTTLRFQAAASSSAAGPFNFVGPDGTAATFFTTSGASLSQFNGKRYLQYKAYLSTTDTSVTPTLNDVTVCESVVDCSSAVPAVTPGAAQACASSTGNTASGPAGASTYSWSITNGTITSGASSQTVTYTAGASGSVGLTLTITTSNGCQAVGSASVPIVAAPSAPVISGPTSACAGTQVQYTATSTGATSFQWFRGATLLGETSSTLTIASAAAGDAGTYTARGVNSCGTSSVSNSIVLAINSAPASVSISGPSTACPGTQVQYTATSAGATSFQWYRGATLLAETSSILTIASAAAGDAGAYTAYGVNSCGTSPVSNSITLSLNPAAPASTTISGPSSACSGTQVQYTATSANATSFQWYRGATLLAETSSTLTIPAVAAGDAGAYTAKGVNSCGTSPASNSITLAVTTVPAAPSITGPSTACSGTQVQYTATSTGATSFQWYRGATLLAETSATLTIASVTAGDAGTYTAYGVNSCGTSTVSNSIALTINSAPASASISGPSSACPGTQVQYTATSAGATSFQWYRGATLLAETSATLTIASAAAGDAGTYTAYGVNSCGSSPVSNSIALTINPAAPTSTTISGPSSACSGTQVQYTATSANATSFQWYRGATLLAETSSTLTIASAAAGDAGTYTAKGVNSCGTSPVSNSIVLTINSAPASISISGPSTACPGTQVQYAATSAGATSFQWYRGATLLAETSSTLTIASVTAGDAGTYTAYGVNSCGTSPVSNSIALTVNPPAPTSTTISGPSTACSGTQVQYTATSSGATSFQWYRGATLLAETTSTLTIPAVAAGDAGTYTAYGVNSCGTSPVSNPIALAVTTAPAAPTITGPSSACSGTQVQYTATSAGATSFQWYRGATLLAETSSTLTITSAAAGDAGTYTAYGVNSCGTSTVSNSITLTINSAPSAPSISGPSTACPGTQVQYTATSAGATSYQWYRDATLLAETSSTLTIASAAAGDAGTYTAYGVNSCGTSTVSNAITLTLNPAAPTTASISGPSTACPGTQVQYTATSAGATSFQWYRGATLLAETSSTLTIASVAAGDAGTYTAYGVNSCGTSSVSNSIALTVNAAAPTTASISGPSTACPGTQVQYTATSAGATSFQWYRGATLLAETSNTLTIASAAAGDAGTYTAYGVNSCGTSSVSNSITLTLNAAAPATASISGPSTACPGTQAQYTATSTGATSFQWYRDATLLAETSNTLTIASAAAGDAGTYTAYGVNSCGTSSVSNSIALTLNAAAPTTASISGPSSACAGTQVQYTATSAGATSFQWYRGATLLAETSATLTIASAAAGDAGTYTAYGVNSCGTSSVSNAIALTVNTVPTAPSITGPSSACPGTQVQYTATSAGATSYQWYRGATLLAETSNTLTIASAAAGDAGTYTAYGVNSCGTSSVSNSITFTLNAAAPTSASISGPSTACPGTQVQYTATSAGASSFQWYRGATLLAETSSTLTIVSAAAGDADTYTAYGVNSCGTSSVSNSITLTLNPAAPTVASISGPSTACPGSQVQYTATSSGATSFQWYRGATLLAETSNTLTIASAAAGDAGTYTAYGVNSCGTSSVSNSITLTLNAAAPAMASISGPSTACPGTQVQYTATSTGATSFQWYRGATLLAETSSTLTIASAAAGDAGTYTAYGVNSCGTSSVSNSITLTLNTAAPTTASISGPSTACSGTQVQYTATSAGATSFQWYRGATLLAETSATLTIASAAAGDAGTYTAYGVNSCGTSSVSNAIALTVNTVPTAPSITGPSTACPGTQVQYTATSSGATSYQWYRDATLLAETSATLTIASAAAGDAGTYTAYGVNSCGTSTVSNSITLTLNPSAPTTASISGPSAACPGTQVQYTATSAGASSFQWYRGATLLAETSSTLTIVSAAAGDAGTYTAYGVNSCGTSSVSNSIALTLNAAAPTTASISGPSTACPGTQVQYTATSAGATSFQWYRGATLLAETSNTLTIASAAAGDAGTYTAYGVNSCGTSSVSNSITLTLNAAAPATASISGPSTACPGTQVQYTATSAGATSFQWYRDATLLAETSNTLTIASAAAGDAGTYTAYGVNSCGTSSVSNSIALTLNAAAPTTASISGPSSACAGTQVQYTATSAGATSFQWYRGATLLAETSATLTIASAAAGDAGTYTAYGVNSCGTSSVSNAIALTVNSAPSAPSISGPSTACPGTQVQYTATSAGATSFQWYRGATLLAETSNTLTIASVAAGDAGTYTAYGVNSCGTSSVSNSIALTLSAAAPATPSISGPSTACPGTQVQYTATSAGATSFQWYRGATLLAETSNMLTIAAVAAGDAGTYTAYGVNSCGTSNVSNSIALTLNAAAPASAAISGPSSACSGTQVQYTATSAGATSFQWYRGATLLAETSATLTMASAVAGTYTAYGVNSCGTSPVSNSIALTVNSAPASVSISGPSAACPGTQVQYTGTSAGATSFQWYRGATLLAETSNTLTIASAAAGDAGTYTAKGVNSCGTSPVSNSITLALNAGVPSAPTISGATSSCGTAVTLTANPTGAGTYQWYRDGNLLGGANASTYSATQSGSYTVTVANSCGTSSLSAAHAVTINAVPDATITAPSTLTSGASGTASVADAGSGATYNWSISGGAITAGAGTRSITFHAGPAGTLTLNVTVTRGACSDSKSANVIVTNGSTTHFDPNNDGIVDPADIFYLVAYLFTGGPAPQGPGGMPSGDANGDGIVDPADIFYVVHYLFTGGPAPMAVTPLQAREQSTPTASALAGSITLGRPIARGDRWVVPVIVNSAAKATAPQAIALKVRFDRDVAEASIARAGAASRLQPAFEVSRASARELSYLAAFADLPAGVVAEIELPSLSAPVRIEIEPSVTMLANAAGTEKATVANGALTIGQPVVASPREKRSETPRNEERQR